MTTSNNLTVPTYPCWTTTNGTGITGQTATLTVLDENTPVSYTNLSDWNSLNIEASYIEAQKSRKKKSLPCPFKVGDRVKILAEHDSNTVAIGTVGVVRDVMKHWDSWWVFVKLQDTTGTYYTEGSFYNWTYPIEKLELSPYEDDLDNWE